MKPPKSEQNSFDYEERLRSMYLGYIESWLQVNHPDLMPETKDYDRVPDENFTGLPVGDAEISEYTGIDYLQLPLEAVDSEVAKARLQKFKEEICKSDVDSSGMLKSEIVEFISLPPPGVVPDKKALIDAFSQVEDPKTGEVTSRQWLEQVLEGVTPVPQIIN